MVIGKVHTCLFINVPETTSPLAHFTSLGTAQFSIEKACIVLPLEVGK
jgi:hypothetical protein